MPDVTAASYPLTLNGITYSLSPLTDRDIEEVNNWLRASVINMARDSLTSDMSKDERSEILGVAMKEARSLSWMHGEGSKIITQSIDGVSRVMYQGVVKNHPNVTFADFLSNMYKDPSGVESSLAIWRELNLKDYEGEDGPPPKREEST